MNERRSVWDTSAYGAGIDYSPLMRAISGYRDAIDQGQDFRNRQDIGAALASDDWAGARSLAAKAGYEPSMLVALGQKQLEDQTRRKTEAAWSSADPAAFEAMGPMGSVVRGLPADQGVPALMDFHKTLSLNDLHRSQANYYRSLAQSQKDKSEAARAALPPNGDADFIKRATALGIKPTYHDDAVPAAPDSTNDGASSVAAPAPTNDGAPSGDTSSPGTIDRNAAVRNGQSWRNIFRGGVGAGAAHTGETSMQDDGQGGGVEVGVTGQFVPDQAAGNGVTIPDEAASNKRTPSSLKGGTAQERYARDNPARYDPSMLTDEERAIGYTVERKLKDAVIRYLAQGNTPQKGFAFALRQGKDGPELIQVPLSENNKRGEMSREMLSFQMSNLEDAFRTLVGTTNKDGSLRYDGRAAGILGGINKAVSQATNGYFNPDINEGYRVAEHAALNLAYALSGMAVGQTEMANILRMYNPQPGDPTEITAFKINAARDLYQMLYNKKASGASDQERTSLFLSALRRTGAEIKRRQAELNGTFDVDAQYGATQRPYNASPAAQPSGQPNAPPDRVRQRLINKYGLE